jgi:hypothetical protein
MNKLIVAMICAMLAFPVLAEGQGGLADETTPPPSEQNAGQTPADVDMANVRSGDQAASGVPATAQPSGEAQFGGSAQQQVDGKSVIPLDKRRGGDITECLQAGDKSDQAINACADKYRPHSRKPPSH